MPSNLQARLIGAWKLIPRVKTPVDGSAERLPLGEHPLGDIIYHPPDTCPPSSCAGIGARFASGDWSAGRAADYQAKATSYFAYCGPSMSLVAMIC